MLIINGRAFHGREFVCYDKDGEVKKVNDEQSLKLFLEYFEGTIVSIKVDGKPVSTKGHKIEFGEIKVMDESYVPERATKGSAGYDLRIPCDLVLEPGAMFSVGLGVKLVLPNNWYANLTTRSSLSIKHGVTMLPANSIIDADYRDEIMMCLWNTTNKKVELVKGERIAQLVLCSFRTIDVIEPTETRCGGIGSTGR